MIIKTITGRGFIKDLSGNIVAKTALPQNADLKLSEDFTYEEQPEAVLNSWKKPYIPSRDEVIQDMIYQKSRKLAVTELLKEGSITLSEAEKIINK